MTRSVARAGVILSLGLGLSGIGTAGAEEGDSQAVRSSRIPKAVRRGVLDLRKAEESERRRQAMGEPAPPAVVHAPLPVPEMPMPPGWTAPPDEAYAERVPAETTLDVASPALSLNFRALDDNNTSIPPDTHGAVGPTRVMTTLNTEVLVQDRSGTTISGPVSLGTWWGLGSGGPATAGVFDPRVHFDPDPAYGGRWIWVACQGARLASSGILVGASASTDPLRGPAALFDADLANLVWADYPSVGFNKHWVVVQVNMFSTTNPYPFVRSEIYVFRKDQLYAGTVAPVVVRSLAAPLCEGLTCGGTQVPALTYDFTQNDLYFLQRWNSGAGALRLYKLSGPLDTPTVTPLSYVIDSPASPWADVGAGGADFAPQGPSCGTNKIQTNDSRIQNVVYRNGRLWATHTVFYPSAAPTRASVQWWQVNTDGSLAQRGIVDDTTGARFYAFPSIAVNKNDDVLLGFSGFHGSEPASARYAFRLATDAPGTMQVPAVFQPGLDCYYKTFGSGKNRWGDYSATVVDPTDDTRMWTIQEYAATSVGAGPNDDRWGTWWGMLDPTPAVSITDATVAEGDTGTTTLSFDVSLSMPTSQTVTVPWSTANGTAFAADNDYASVASGSVVFAPTETLKTIQVTVNGDIKYEVDETLFANLGVPTNATIADGQGLGTITNDDALPRISIVDRRVVEGNTGIAPPTPATFKVVLANPSGSGVTVDFATAGGTAMSGTDFQLLSGTVTFPAAAGTGPFPPAAVEQTLTVQVVGDTSGEPDERYFVDLLSSPPPVGGSIFRSRAVGTILDDDTSNPPVSALTVVSDSVGAGPNDGRNRLEWVNPAASSPETIRIRKAQSAAKVADGGSCIAPPDPTTVPYTDLPCPGGICPSSHDDLPLANDYAYCYSVWAARDPDGAGPAPPEWSPRATATGVPFDSSGAVKWKYQIGSAMTALAPPSIGADGVLVPSNDNWLYGMSRTAGGGVWPAGWQPANLGSPAQARSPIVELGGVPHAFFTTQDGWVHAVDARTGNILWETQLTPSAGQAAPAGIFTAFGGDWDYLLVGTAAADNNRFYALDPLTGAEIDYFPRAGDGYSGLGAILGMAAVDYQRGKVYFGTFDGTSTNRLWCLNLGPPGDALQFGWALDQTIVGNINGSPVARGNRVYVGNTVDSLWAIDPDTPLNRYAYSTGDGGVKGFPFPDRASNAVYLSTNGKVHGVADNGSALIPFGGPFWPFSLTNPSPVLLSSAGKLYVGAAAGRLWVIDLGASTASSIILDNAAAPAVIGAPSLDASQAPNIVHVGSTNGIFYAVAVP